MRSGTRFRVIPQGFAHLEHQRIAREGLLKAKILLQEVIVASVVFEVAGRIHDPQPGPEVLESLGELRWSHLGHHDIDKQQMAARLYFSC